MTIVHRSFSAGRRFFLLSRWIIPLALALGVFVPRTSAQTGDDSWSEPVNVSRSGGTSAPQISMDSQGIFHVFWTDEYSKFGYTYGDGTTWADSASAEGPYEDFVPQVFFDLNGLTHAFWTDDNGIFWTGRIRTNDFPDPLSWITVSQMGSFVGDLDFAADSQGGSHLVYIRTQDTAEQPSGVYYQHLKRGGSSWSLPVLLYQSDYLRSATSENSNLQIVTSTVDDVVQIYIVWDNRPRERVYLTRSLDGGKLWSPPEEIDRPEEGTINTGASNIRVGVNGSEVLLTWQSGKTETSCNQYYQFSPDSGNTWGTRQRMFEGFQICPDDVQIMYGETGPILLLTGVQVYLQAWDGERWSDPQLQETLSTFIDPETQNVVALGCQKGFLGADGSLYVFGCDLNPAMDTWSFRRQLLDIAQWFPQEAVWNPPVSVTNSDQPISYSTLVADSRGRLHGFWSQADPAKPQGPGKTIYYSRWESGTWSPAAAIMSSPQGKADQPDAAYILDNRLFLVWSGGNGGEILYSFANADQAVLAESWDKPQPLPAVQPSGSAPAALVDSAGVIYAAYAIPLNEGRGIYLVRSEDGGQTWTEPVVVFDAGEAGWAMVDQPHLAVTENGNLHVIWTRYSLPGGEGPLSMYYSRSEDGGAAWTPPQVVVEKPIGWSEIAGIGANTLHRVWQEGSGGNTTLWHEQSKDGGLTWVRTAPVSVFGTTVGQPSLTWDDSGRLQLLQVVQTGTNQYVLQHWQFDGTRWSAERSLDIQFPTDTAVTGNVAEITGESNLGVLLSVQSGDLERGDAQDQLLFTNRQVDLSVSSEPPVAQPEITAIPVEQPSASPTPEPTAALTETPANQPLATDGVATDVPTPLPQNPVGGNRSWLGSLVGPLAAGVIVLVIAVISFRALQSRRR